jgi:hypothetical protein
MSTSLLQSCSYQTEKYFKRRGGRFEVVLYVTLDKNGRREWFERDCFSAPKEPSDEEILKGLAWELPGLSRPLELSVSRSRIWQITCGK